MKLINPLWLFLLATLLSACQPSYTPTVEAWSYQNPADSTWGLMATDGNILLPAGTFSYQPSALVNGRFTLPNANGQYTLHSLEHPAQPVCCQSFARIGHFFEEVAPAQETPYSPLLLIDKQGHTRFSSEQFANYDLVLMHNFSDERALVATSDGKYGYLNPQGELVIPPLYQQAYDFHEDWALVGLANTQGEIGYQFIDKQGKIQLAIQHRHVWIDHGFHNGLLLIKHLDTQQYGYLNKEGKEIIYLPKEVTEAHAFRQGIACFQIATGMGAINQKGDLILPPQYDHIDVAGESYLWVQLNQRWALFRTNGERLTDFIYDQKGLISAQGTVCDLHPSHWVEDPTALKFKSQTFLRQTQPSALSADSKDSINHPKTVKPVQAKVQPTAPQKSNRPKEMVYTTDDWKKISQKSPFFAEAQKVFSGHLKEEDASRRRMILNYVEHFRTSYTTKDIHFLEQLFSEEALIIVGKVIRSEQLPEGGFLTPEKVIYNVKSKRQYLDRLKQVFQANQKIDLKFSDFEIKRHATNPAIYGVRLRQGYQSDLYSDDGYLFLLWDFTDETAPKIHVRTWQPAMINKHTPLPEEDILSIRDFNLR